MPTQELRCGAHACVRVSDGAAAARVKRVKSERNGKKKKHAVLQPPAGM